MWIYHPILRAGDKNAIAAAAAAAIPNASNAAAAAAAGCYIPSN